MDLYKVPPLPDHSTLAVIFVGVIGACFAVYSAFSPFSGVVAMTGCILLMMLCMAGKTSDLVFTNSLLINSMVATSMGAFYAWVCYQMNDDLNANTAPDAWTTQNYILVALWVSFFALVLVLFNRVLAAYETYFTGALYLVSCTIVLFASMQAANIYFKTSG